MARMRNIANKALTSRERDRVPIVMRAPAVARTTRFNADAHDGGRPAGFWQLLARPSALFCVSLFAFVVVSGVRAWEMGVFEPVFGPKGAAPIEAGPIRFAPHERVASKPYTAEPEPVPVAKPDEPDEDGHDKNGPDKNGDAR